MKQQNNLAISLTLIAFIIVLGLLMSLGGCATTKQNPSGDYLPLVESYCTEN